MTAPDSDLEAELAQMHGRVEWERARADAAERARDATARAPAMGAPGDRGERQGALAQAEAMLAERTRLAFLSGEIGAALVQAESLAAVLRRCAEAFVRHLDVAFARIWTLNEPAQVLELQASAGHYTHLDGPHSRIPVGQLKIGQIARNRRPHLTNAVIGDPRVSDQEWASREGMVAFAGYPLMVADALVGVLAMFARQPLSPTTLEGMATVANGIALRIERAHAESALRASEERLQRLVDTASAGIHLFDHDGTYLLVNPAAEAITGHPRREWEGARYDAAPFRRLTRDGRPFPPEEHPFAQVKRTGAAISDVQYGIERPDGKVTIVSMNAAPLFDDDGSLSGVVAVMTDVTAQRELEQQRALFLASTSHDLRNPITIIKGTAQVLLRQLQRGRTLDAEQLRAALASIDSAAGQLSDQVGELLDVTRQGLGEGLELNREAVDLLALAHTAVTQQQQASDRHQIELVGAEDPLIGEWDAARLRRVLANLLSNAVKYSPAGGAVTVSITREQQAGVDGAAITVSDAGLGIPAADLPFIFERFRRGENVAGRIAGTGIGLVDVREVVEAHGGSIAVESEEGSGSAFTVWLPLEPLQSP